MAELRECRVVQRDAVAPERVAGREQSLAERAGELLERSPARAGDLDRVARSELLVLSSARKTCVCQCSSRPSNRNTADESTR